ncbi:MAG: sugar phosphate isomerase/epimerase [Clostridia bacterium]|nr:sugar phosphate isomerase/epimerase [Clostridia bacterium]
MNPEQFRLGISKWWPANGPLPSVKLIKKLKDAGINWIETGIRQKTGYKAFEANTRRLVKVVERFREHGINVWSVHTPFGVEIDISNPRYAKAGIALYAEIMDACNSLKIDRVIVHGSSEPIPAEDRQERIACCINSLKELYRPDVKIALENLPRTCVGNSIEDMKYILKVLDGKVGCCVDVNHFHGGNIIDMIKAVEYYLETLHISDDDGLDEKHWLPGQGVLDWNGILGALVEMNYDGVFMYEVMAKFADPVGIRNNYNDLIRKYNC